MSSQIKAIVNAKAAAIAALGSVLAEYDSYRAACQVVDAAPESAAKVWPTMRAITKRETLAFWARKQLVSPNDCSGLTPTDKRLRRVERKYRHGVDSVARSGAYGSFGEGGKS